MADRVQYGEFAVTSVDIAESEKYWLSVFDDELPALELPTDFPRGEKQSFAGSAIYDAIDIELHDSISKKCRELNITPYAFYMGCFNILLSKFSGDEDLIVGMPVSGRDSKYLNTIGMFVNTIALRNKPVGTKTVSSFLNEVKETSVSAIANQNYPFGELVKKLKIESKNRNPLFDVMFAYQSEQMTDIVFGDEEVELVPVPVTTSKCDFTFHIMPRFNDVVIMAEYCTDLYKQTTIQKFIDSFKHILKQALSENTLIKDISAIGEEEKQKLLYDFNDTAVDYPTDKFVHEIFEEQAEKTPDKTAIVACDKTLTYKELNEKANKIAHSLIEKGIGVGDIVAFRLPRKCSLIATMFGIIKTGAAYLPVDPDWPQDRIEYILGDSGAKLLITEDNIEELLDNSNSSNPETKVCGENMCYCIYTSGSTGMPKGVMIKHSNVLNYVSNNANNVYGGIIKENCKNILSVTTASFDIFVTESLMPLVNGMTVIMADEKQSNTQKELNELLKKTRADVMQTTPSKMKMLISNRAYTDYLKAMKTIIIGGEAMDRSLAKELKEITDAEIYNIYGPTETTVWSSYSKIENDDITIGKPIANTQIYIVDKYMQPTPIGVVGELCIAGDGVAAGYLNRPELTTEKFVDNPFGNGKLYKTGDLAYFREDGNIDYVGRNDFQVKIRGLRIELGEIENAITSVDGIENAVVIVRKDETGRQLICAFYTGTDLDTKEIRAHISKQLPKYMLPHIFTHLDEIPLNSSGKINRKALPEVDLENIETGVEYIEPQTQQEKALVDSIEAVLKADKVGLLDNFFDLGGDSLKAIELIAKLNGCGYDVETKTVFECENIKELAEKITVKENTEEKITYDSIIPATAAQMRVYTALSVNGNSTLYNISNVFKVKNLDADKLQTAINKLIERHESLRTHFENRDGTIVQVIDEEAKLKLQKLESEDTSDFIKPFDLEKSPLIHVGYYENTVMIDLHHIIADGGAMPVFFSELNELYMGREPKDIPVQYGEFTVTPVDTENSEKYWLTVFDDELPVPQLPTDFPRAEKQSFAGSAIYDAIEIELHDSISKKCRELNITPYVFYMGCFNILLSKFSGDEDLIVGMPVSGRDSKYLNTIGMFVNTIALRNKPVGTKTVSSFLNEVKETSVSAIANQNYPFGELVKKLKIESKNRNPLFDVMLAYQSEQMTDIVFGDEEAELVPVPVTTSKCDFTFHIMPRFNDVVIMAEYCTDLYKQATIQKFIDSFKHILKQALSENTLIKDISAVGETDLSVLIGESIELDPDATLYSLFEKYAYANGDKTCILDDDKNITFKEFVCLAELLDCVIRKKIGDKKQIIGVCTDRSLEMYLSVYAIIRGGNAYMPINTEQPSKRTEYMINNSNVSLVLGQGQYRENVGNAEFLDVTAFLQEENNKASVLPVCAKADDAAYVIYTSGTTGNPKGAMISHRSIVNRINWMHRKYPVNDESVILQKTPYTFDVSVWELFWWGLFGGKLAYSKPNEHFLPAKLIEEIIRHRVTHIHFVPAVFSTFLDYIEKNQVNAKNLNSLKYIFLSGEALSAALVDKFYKIFGDTDIGLHNLYGPTECAVDVTYYDCKNTSESIIPIGKPIDNTEIYLMDKYLKPVPIGAVGEIYIGGVNVGMGYVNNLKLTQNAFVENSPYSARLYKTGDIGYIDENGQIIFLGRNDFQVKINGLRIELGEIENVISEMDGISQTAVVVRKNDEGRQFICAFYSGKEKDAAEIRQSIGTKLPKYMFPHIYIHLDEMPMNASGKVSRKALPEVDLQNIDSKVEYIKPQTEQEKALVSAVETTLKAEKVGLLDSFFDLGGDSLKSIELVSRLESCGYSVDTKTIFECENIKELAEKITVKENNEEKITYGSVIPATPAQMRMYTAQSISGNTTLYNVWSAFKTKKLDVKRLQTAINKLIKRHESLRTHFENRDGKIYQVIDEPAELKIEARENDDIHSFVRPFDLTKSPLMRIGYFENTVMIDFHHTIVDGGSLSVLSGELNELYMDRELKDKVVQYGEFAVTPVDTEKSEKYWLSVFDDELPVLELPTDFPRGEKQSFAGSTVSDIIDVELHNSIRKKCKELNITPYAFYMGCFNIMLSKFSGCEDIIVGMPVSGRESKYLNTIGMFVNTIALRNKPIGTKTVSSFLTEVKENSATAIANQNYPFGDLVKKLKIESHGRNPLFDVVFAYQYELTTDIVFGDETPEPVSSTTTTAKNDFSLSIVPVDNNYAIVNAEYCTDLYKRSTIEKFIAGFKLILSQALGENTQIKDISVISEAERQKLLYDFNDTEADYPKDKCIYELFEEQVRETPDKPAVIEGDKAITYEELHGLVNSYCAKLQAIGIKKNDVVAVHLERSYELIVFQLAILKAGAVFLPADMRYPKERISYMCKDCNVSVLISDELYDIKDTYVVSSEEFKGIEEKSESKTVENLDVCYIIYTSGSTGTPKGCMLKNEGLVNFCKNNNTLKTLQKRENNIFACVNSVSFDYFIAESLLPLLNGYTTVILDDDESTNQKLFLEEVRKNGINVLMTTPTRLKIFFDDRCDCEILKQMNCICSSGEALLAELLGVMYEKAPNAKIYNPLGPSECSVWDVGGELSRENGIDVHIGKPIANTQIYILDKYMQPTPIGVTGELCIAGVGVGAGYLNRPELTAEKFVRNPFGEGKLYKTGDLTYWREDGNIVYVGRNDFQVKIRGLRIELGEIENAILETYGISQTAVVVRKNDEGRQFICAFYSGEEKNAVEIRQAIGEKLPKYMLPHIFTRLDEMPMTSSGKINRNALPEIDLENFETGVEYVEPQTDREKIMVSAIETVLEADKVSMLDNFFDLGGDSLKAIELISQLETGGYYVDIKTIFECKNIKEFAERLIVKENNEEKITYGSVIPATPAQMRIYTAQSISGDTTLYNVPNAFNVKNLDVERLQTAINKLIKRHEALRTHFENRDGKIYQVIDESAELKIEARENDDINSFVRPFDLTKSPLIRVGYFENTVMIDLHHIIADGGAIPVLSGELNELYMGRDLKGEATQYGEFAVTPVDTEESEKYWLSVFDDELPVSELPTDYPRGEKQSFAGSTVSDVIDIELHNSIRKKCKELNITPYAFYMGCFNILLSKFSGCEDIIVGMPVSGRESKYLNTIGMFVNTIALRNKPVGTKTVSSFLTEVKENSVSAIANQNYPFGELIRKLKIESLNRNPLFDVMFVYQREHTTDAASDEEIKLLPVSVSTSKYDFTFEISPGDKDAVISVEYCSDLYKRSTIEKIIAGFKLILAQALSENTLIKDISVISEAERQKLLYDFNDTAADYPKDKCVYELFEEQARVAPDKTAVIAGDKAITYEELHGLVNSYCAKLQAIGVKKNDVVAVHLERSYELVVFQLAILKAGAVFLPADMRYPKERISYMCKDCNVSVLISDESYSIENVQVISSKEFKNIKEKNAAKTVENLDVCYIIYTSGSTGTPKGCMLKNEGLVNFCKNNNTLKTLQKREHNIFACVNSVSFDYFIAESLLPLLNGYTTVILDDDESTNQKLFLEEVRKKGINVLMTTPTRLKIFFGDRCDCELLKQMDCICSSGEALPAELLGVMYEKAPNAKIYNPLGPSECSVWDVGGELSRENEIDVHIGKPIANTQIYILDKYMQPTPIGVTGELCIAGVGVGAGYLNRPELTAEKFARNPFGEGKLYKTGDLAYWREDGNIAYVGRNDFQVKIRGLRIELGEIEKAISSVDGITQSVVIVKKDKTGRQLIYAFYTGEEKDAAEIRQAIGEKLPQYMVPSVFVYMDEIPVNRNGKTDKKLLSSINVQIVEASPSKESLPRNRTEEMICEAFADVLGIGEINRDTNFIAAGGTSLDIIMFVSDERFNEISVKDFISNPTPAGIAKLLKTKKQSELRYVSVLKYSQQSDKAVVIFPFAGGTAASFAQLAESIYADGDASVYFVDIPDSPEDLHTIAREIAELTLNCDVAFYGHCVGAQLAVNTASLVESEGYSIKGIVSAAYVPATKKSRINTWNLMPDSRIIRVLSKSGADFGNLPRETVNKIIRQFRDNTDFTVKYLLPMTAKTHAPIKVLLADRDVFTRDYKDPLGNFLTVSDKVLSVDSFSSDSHYFQTEKTDLIVKSIKSVLEN